MMKLLIILLLTSYHLPFEMTAVRESYISAAQSEDHAIKFYKKFEQMEASHPNATMVAYKAASIVLKARYENSIFAKARLFNRGTDLLDATIAKYPSDYEARLIRLNIQDNVPWITGYKSEIKKDKAFLIANYAKQPSDLRVFARQYVQQSEAFSAKEKQVFN